MRERFSTPPSLSKKMGQREIEEGVIDYLSSPKSKEGLHPELAESFEVEVSESPLRREDVEREAKEFIERNFDKILPVLLANQASHAHLIRSLGITNEQIGLLGANYFIGEENGRPAIYQADEYNPDGRRVYENDYNGVSNADLLALGWAKHSLRMDTQSEADRIGGSVSHRYFLKSQNRYLCKNDFGMRRYDEEEGRMVEGESNDVAPFVQTVGRQFDRVKENLDNAFRPLVEKIREEVQAETEFPNQADIQDWNAYRTEYERVHTEMEREISLRVVEAISAHLQEHPKDRDLIMEAIPVRKVSTQLHFQYDRIARKYGVTGSNPVDDYEKFNRSGHRRIEKLLSEPTDEEKSGTTLRFVHSDLFKKPTIVWGNFEIDSLVSQAKGGVRDVLAQKAAEADPVVSEAFARYRCGRGEQSPYFYNDHQVYDFIRHVGAERASEILDADDRNVSEQMAGFGYLQALGYNLQDWEPTRVKKQLHEAHKLNRANIWRYLHERSQGADSEEVRMSEQDWLASESKRKARNLFREGKRMYWLAQQVFIKSPHHSQDDRFYHQDSYVDWSRYDLSKADVPDEKLSEYLDKHKNLIIVLLGQGAEQDRYGAQVGEAKKGKGATLGLIIQALERGQDLRGVALAHDKERYLEGLIKGEVENDLEFALADWPEEWRESVTQGEIELYYDYANDYVQLDPNGLAKYAEWRATPEGKNWSSVFEQDPQQKSELDFRICLGSQTEEIRSWYKEAAEYVGGATVQDYLLRFNATRDTEGRLANWHDVLFWVPNIRKLEAGEAKSILTGIQTMDDNQEFIALLPRYSKERDPLTEHGPVQSIRELKKRILAIESNIDLSELPPEIFEITTAPGFNLAALESLRRRADFQDLVEGKMDKEQPFKPHTRVFAGLDLTQSLREGLGSRKLKIEGTAQSVRKLFHELNQLVKGKTVGKEGRKMQVTDLLDNIPVELEEEIIKLLRDQNVDVGPIIEAQVHAKSDPEGWVCGNYTDCCMPFGASNNDDYMFNRSTQYFTVKYNGRIVAQSVVVDGVDSRDGKDVVILDNIEVANNYKKLSPQLARAYQVFWTEYTSKAVKVGTGYSDLIPPGGKLEGNNYRSKTPLSYSDANGAQIYDLPKMRGVESLDEIVTFANLTERDAQLIAELEAKIYPEGMTQGKAHILDIIQKQRELDVPGAASSFVIRQGNEAVGYLLMLPEDSEVQPGEKCAHVHDMAILPEFQGKGLARQMMERVLDVATAYNVAIEAEARASTSYAMLMNDSVRSWFESRGFYLTKNEKKPKYMDGEDFYFVRFENRQQV